MRNAAWPWRLLLTCLLLLVVGAVGIDCRHSSLESEAAASASAPVHLTAAPVPTSSKPGASGSVAPVRKPARGLWWKVTSGGTTMYLLGSIHVASADLYPLDPRIESAFSSADALVLEVDLTQIHLASVGMKMGEVASYPAGDSLDRHVTAKTIQLLEKYAPGGLMSVSTLKRFRPWFVATTILQAKLERLGYDQAHGLDQHFAELAKGKKEVIGLETLDDQVEIFAKMPENTQRLMLEQTLDDLDQIEPTMKSVVQAWRRGDPELLDEQMLTPMRAPEFRPVFVKLFAVRNLNWERKLLEYLQTRKTYFVVVGAGHLIGKDSVIDLLERRHYQVVPQWKGAN